MANVFHAGDGNLHPLVLFDDAVAGRGRAGRGGLRAILDLCSRTAARSPASTASARTRRVHAEHVHRRRPRHHAAAAMRVRPATVASTPARCFRRPGSAARSPAGARASIRSDGRARGGLLMGEYGRLWMLCATLSTMPGWRHPVTTWTAFTASYVASPDDADRRRRRARGVAAATAAVVLRGGAPSWPGAPRRAAPTSRSTPPGLDRVVAHDAGDLFSSARRYAARRRAGGAGAGRAAADLDPRTPGEPSAASSRPTPAARCACATARRATCVIGVRSSAPTARSPRPAAGSSRTSPATTSPSCSAARSARWA